MKKLGLLVILVLGFAIFVAGSAQAQITSGNLAYYCYDPSWWDASTKTCTVPAGSYLYLSPYANLSIDSDETLVVIGSFDPGRGAYNYGTIDNTGTIFIGSYFFNYGSLRNDNSTLIDTFGIVHNYGFIFNHAGTIELAGRIYEYRCPGNVGVITGGTANVTLEPGAFIENRASWVCP